MKIIAFDLSSHTGYSVFDEQGKLLDYGLIEESIPDYYAKVKSYKDFPASYPYNIFDTANKIAEKCVEVYLKYPGAQIVSEHTESSSFRVSQLFLGFVHFAFISAFRNNGQMINYLLNKDWRTVVKCYGKYHPHVQEHNKLVSKAKKQLKKDNPEKRALAKIDGKVVSRIDQKKLSIYLANKEFGLEVDDDNIADAINLGFAYYKIKNNLV